MLKKKAVEKPIKASANRTTCWPTFGPTSAGQHVCLVCFGHEHVGEERNEGKMYFLKN